MERGETGKSSTTSLRAIFRVLTYYALVWAIFLLLVTCGGHLIVVPLLTLLLLWCTRASCPLRPKLPNRHFTRAQTSVWYAGEVVCVLTALAISRAIGARGALPMLQAVAAATGSWASAFLAYRDCSQVCLMEREGRFKSG